eukprot:1150961-Pelagomonas_calceolata.AAC.8
MGVSGRGEQPPSIRKKLGSFAYSLPHSYEFEPYSLIRPDTLALAVVQRKAGTEHKADCLAPGIIQKHACHSDSHDILPGSRGRVHARRRMADNLTDPH